MAPTERFHFDLRLPEGDSPSGLHLRLSGEAIALRRHDAATLAGSLGDNPALALLPQEERERFRHYVDVPSMHFPSDQVRLMQVTCDHDDPRLKLPALVWCGLHIPEAQLRAASRSPYVPHDLAASGGPRPHGCGAELVFAEYGVREVEFDDELIVAAARMMTPIEIAKMIVFQHPNLASADTHTAARVMSDHIMHPRNFGAIRELYLSISRQGRARPDRGFARITQSADGAGKGLTYGVKLGENQPGDPVLHYEPSAETKRLAAAAFRLPGRTSRDDEKLRGRKWSTLPATTAQQRHVDTAQAQLRDRPAPSGPGETKYHWTVSDPEHAFGLSLDKGSLRLDGSKFSINSLNIFMRTVGVHVEFYAAGDKLIENPAGWERKKKWNAIHKWETDSKKYVDAVSPVNTFLAAPLPFATDPTTLEFVWPDEAVRAHLLFGSLGTSDWNPECAAGALLTIGFNYMLPLFLMGLGTAADNRGLIRWMLKDEEHIAGVLALLGAAFVGGEIAASALDKTKWYLAAAASAAAGIMVSKAMAFAIEKLLARIAASQLAESVPLIGLGLWLAAELVDAAQLVETTVEILCSPATVRFDVTRAFDLELTVHPDPKHGEPGNESSAVWPALADHFQVTVQHRGGSNVVRYGAMPTSTSHAPLKLTIADLPAGGEFQVIVGVYAKNGWLCGRWSSKWTPATPTEGALRRMEGRIEEQLVPLSAATQYSFKEKFAYDPGAGRHAWQASDKPPTATRAQLDCDESRAALCEVLGLTLNNKANQIGYTWRANGQNIPRCESQGPGAGQVHVFQNASVLDEDRMKYPGCSFTGRPALAYDQYGPTKSGDKVPGNNFLLDPRGGQNHLRRIDLMDGGKVLDLTPPLPSWGRIPLPFLDALVVHPAGYVVGVSWDQHKLAVLKIPAGATKDADAQPAVVTSGPGVLEGLVHGPIALAVTPDGRLLVLESLNERVQAFDVAGNAVPSFTDAKALYSGAVGELGNDLDQQRFSPAWQQVFRSLGIGKLCAVAKEHAADLDRKVLTKPLRDELTTAGIILSWNDQDPKDCSTVEPEQSAGQWRINDPVRKGTYHVELRDEALAVFFTPVPRIEVRRAGREWILRDPDSSRCHRVLVTEKNDRLELYPYRSTFVLEAPPIPKVTYLDIATESKGYIYVLSYTGTGASEKDYILDLYDPDGHFLSRTPQDPSVPGAQHVAASRLAVDIWRTLYALDYELTTGPGGRVEPSIGHWVPSPPLFDLPYQDAGPAFEKLDITTIKELFAKHGVTLPAGATAQRESASAEHWLVTGDTSYRAIRNASLISVYLKAAAAGLVDDGH